VKVHQSALVGWESIIHQDLDPITKMPKSKSEIEKKINHLFETNVGQYFLLIATFKILGKDNKGPYNTVR
jgi:hypothetical protein